MPKFSDWNRVSNIQRIMIFAAPTLKSLLKYSHTCSTWKNTADNYLDSGQLKSLLKLESEREFLKAALNESRIPILNFLINVYNQRGLLKAFLEEIGGFRALRDAANEGRFDVMKILLNAYMTLNDKDFIKQECSKRNHYLTWSPAQSGNINIVEIVLKTYVALEDPNFLKQALRSSTITLRSATLNGHVDEVVGNVGLYLAITRGHFALVSIFLNAYTTLEDNEFFKEALAALNHGALRLATEKGRVEVVQRLLDAYKAVEDKNVLQQGIDTVKRSMGANAIMQSTLEKFQNSLCTPLMMAPDACFQFFPKSRMSSTL